MLDKFNYWYFVIHIPITVVMDSTIVIPPVFEFQQALINFHVNQNKDFLMVVKPLWFKTFVWIELLFQLPYFFMALQLITKKDPKRFIYNMLYGFNAGLTTFVCIMYDIFQGSEYQLNTKDIIQLVSIYLPYLIIPLVIMVNSYKLLVKTLESKQKPS